MAKSDLHGLTRYVAHQAYYSLVGRDYEWELMPLALDQGIGTVVWSPLGRARLDAASDVTPAYPYWHQQGFERNPPPV